MHNRLTASGSSAGALTHPNELLHFSVMTITNRAHGIAPPGYRLPGDIRLGRVVLQISDLERSLEYYHRVLGMTVIRRKRGRAELGVPNGSVTLVELWECVGADPVPRRGRLGLYHYAILLPDRPSLARFASHISKIGGHVGMADHFVSEAIYLADPDGLGIEVYADKPRSGWRTQGRELYMTTEPLDLDDLMRALPDPREAWTGMPAGTVMGHVHLHVSSLEMAAEFYHSGLGLDKVVWSYPGALFFSAGGYHHHLGTNTWAAGAEPAGEGDARLVEWTIRFRRSEEVEQAVSSIEAAGYRSEGEPPSRRVTDPWGVGLRLVQDLEED